MDLPLPLVFAVQQGIEAALKLDPATRDALSSIDSKIIRIVVLRPSISLHLSVVDNEVDVIGTFDAEPDTTITGSLKALLSLKQANDALYKGDVKITGDTETAEALRNIIMGVDISMEEVLAPVTGDTVAHQLGRVGKQLGQWLGHTGESFKQNTSEYLQEEAQLLAPNSEVRRFCESVDDVNAEADRLQARLALLEKAPDSTT